MYGLVLGGGGARGAYEVGVWSALTETDIKVGAVCGTSIGSINAAMFAQGDYQTAENIWRSISISEVVDMSGFSGEKLVSVKNIGAIIDEMRKNRGISLAPLEKLLTDVVDENKLMLSPIDFGLVTYSLSDNERIELFKADIPKGMLVDYLMASCCLPGTRARVIGDKTFIDGGVADNKPVGMLIKKGYRDIISVDVGGVGVVKHYVPDGVNVIDIRCSNPPVGVLDFDSEPISAAIDMGYFDTKRALGKFGGDIYAIRISDYVRARSKYSAELISGLEKAADIFGVDRLREYTVISLARAMLKEYKAMLTKQKRNGFETVSSPAALLTAVCVYMSDGGNEIIPKIAATALKKYASVANAVCYFARNL